MYDTDVYHRLLIVDSGVQTYNLSFINTKKYKGIRNMRNNAKSAFLMPQLPTLSTFGPEKFN